MTSIATRLEADSNARAKFVAIVVRLMGIGAIALVVALASLLHQLS